MKRRWNASIWAGFLIVLAGVFSYLPFFARYPLTRDFPWANLILFALGAGLISVGVARALRQPELFRGKIAGPAVGVLSLALIALFLHGIFQDARRLPPAKGSPQIGQKAPDFTLPDKDGQPVQLSALLAFPAAPPEVARPRAVLLIFYRGHW